MKLLLALLVLALLAVGCTGETSTSTIGELIPPEGEGLPLPSTPVQQEGPFYPVEPFDDQDSDLTVVEGLDGTSSGNVLILSGLLVTTDGVPVDGGVVEIWQTDANGVYLHPGDPGIADRDPYFQGSGTATAGADGAWSFRTIDPGFYEPRPRHIHFKVHLDGQVVLISQIYFSDDPDADGIDERLVAGIAQGADEDGNAVLVADHRIVLEPDQ